MWISPAGRIAWRTAPLEMQVRSDSGFGCAENEAAVKEHAKLSGFPATKITEVRTVLDPMTEAA